MGTEIQANACLSRYYSMVNLEGSTSIGTESAYQDNTVKNGQYCCSFLSLKSSDGYLNREMIRQTILKQESIFRDQLQELHRLYKRQKDLMKELKSGRLDIDCGKAEKFASSPVFSLVPSEDSQRTRNVSHSSLLHSMISRLPTPGPNTGESVNANAGFLLSPKDFFCSPIDGRYSVSPLSNLQCRSVRNKKGPQNIDSTAVPAEARNEFSTQCPLDVHNSVAWKKNTIFGVEISEGTNDHLGVAFNNSSQDQETELVKSESLYASLWRKTCSTLGQKVRSVQEDDASGVMSLKPQEHLKTDSRHSENFQKKAIPLHNPVFSDSQIKPECPEGRLPWFLRKPQYKGDRDNERKTSYFMTLDSLQNYSQQFFNKTKTADVYPQILDKKQENPSVVNTQDTEGTIIEVGDGPDAKDILGGSLNRSTSSDLSRNQCETKELVLQKGLNSYISGLRHIDLNLSLDEEEAPFVPPLPTAIVKIATTEIDLEAPAVIDSETDASPRRTEVPQGNFNRPYEDCIRTAAEAIVSISLLDRKGLIDDGNYEPLESVSSDRLKWFADIISAQCGDNKIIVEEVSKGPTRASDEKSIPSCMDYFEFMTLKLKDMKEDLDFCKPTELESNNNNEEKGSAVLCKRPRRRQGSRGRHDFQRDILPGIVKLSRQEVTEDFQTFEELLKAKGCLTQSSLSLRNARGRKRPTLSLTLKEKSICQESRLEEKSLTGWGKRTRRLPRQRRATMYSNQTPKHSKPVGLS